MGHVIGDSIFLRNGTPGAVVGKRPETGELVVETKGESAEAIKKRGYINGLTPEERVKFNQIVDSVREIGEPAKQVEALTKQIDELKVDPRQRILTKYLNSERAHIMNSYNIQPRQYTVSEVDI